MVAIISHHIFFSGEPELELTTLSGELLLALTRSAGYATKKNYREWGEFFSGQYLLPISTYIKVNFKRGQ